MPKPLFRSLRVQVLLWTILPLLIVLLTFSLSGAGSHQFSVRRLVVEENTHLIGVAAAAIQARLAHLGAQAAAGEIAAGEIAAGETGGPGGGPWLGFDAAAGRIVWQQAQAGGSRPAGGVPGGVPGSVPGSALGLAGLFAAEQAAPTIAVVDAQMQVVDANTTAGDPALAPPAALVAAALRGESGVQFITQDGVQTVVAYAPLRGTPWAILIQRPMAGLIAPFFRYEQVLPLILLAAALVSFLTLHFGLRLVVRPVHALIDCAAAIGEGNFWAASHSVGGVQEIEELRQALHAMAQLLQSERAALQDYLRAVTNTQEEERARLARELHDETVQTLIALDHKAQQVQRGLDKHPERTREQVAELRKITAQATQEVRRLSYGLRPLGLEEIGLDSALERLAREGCARYRCQGELRRLGAERELAFYRIAQESLANVRRHARAEQVRMILVFGPHTVTLGIGDDGVGFDLPPKLADLTREGHFGLMGITERAQLIGGRLYCESRPRQGTTIIVQAPCEGCGGAPDQAVISEVRRWLAAS